MSDFLKTISRPVISEKATLLQKEEQYIFLVPKSATKSDIKNAVFHLYGTPVAKVNMVSLPAKSRLVGRGRMRSKRPALKKAIVTLQGRKSLDLYKFKAPKKDKLKEKKERETDKTAKAEKAEKVERSKIKPSEKKEAKVEKKKLFSFLKKSK